MQGQGCYLMGPAIVKQSLHLFFLKLTQMKKSLFTIVISMTCIMYCFGQEIDRFLVAVGGDNQRAKTANVSLQWTVGETSINTLQASTHLSEGFQQGTLPAKKPIIQKQQYLPQKKNTFELVCFPNPTLDVPRLQLSTTDNQQQVYTTIITDNTGKQYAQTQIRENEWLVLSEVTNLPAGQYHIQVYQKKALVVSRSFLKL